MLKFSDSNGNRLGNDDQTMAITQFKKKKNKKKT